MLTMDATATTGEPMKARTPLLALLALGALLALAPATQAATPFTAGTGSGHDLAVGSDGTGHVVWLQDESRRTGSHYCRVPAGGSACDSESTLPDLPGPTLAANATGDAQVFTPAPNKVVILASCIQCADGGHLRPHLSASSRPTTEWTSAPRSRSGTLELNGQAAFVNSAQRVARGRGRRRSRRRTRRSDAPDTAGASLATGGLFVYSPSVVYNEAVRPRPCMR